MSAARAADERGTVTFWLLGLCLMLLVLGGIGLDLSRSFSQRRALAADADAAALAGASAIDEDAYRATGRVELVPAAAEALARGSIARQPDRGEIRDVEVRATAAAVTVVVFGHVDLSLLRLLHTADLDVRFVATAAPRRSP